MDDLIRRQDAITIPILPKEHRKYQTMNLDDAYELGWFDCQKCIEELPSAQPERKVGKWIPCDVDSRGMTNMFVCSKCGSFTSLPILKYANAMEYDFCPNCGADMRGEQNE